MHALRSLDWTTARSAKQALERVHPADGLLHALRYCDGCFRTAEPRQKRVSETHHSMRPMQFFALNQRVPQYAGGMRRLQSHCLTQGQAHTRVSMRTLRQDHSARCHASSLEHLHHGHAVRSSRVQVSAIFFCFFFADFCRGRQFVSKQKIEQHVRDRHDGETIPCFNCNQLFPDLSKLLLHVLTEHFRKNAPREIRNNLAAMLRRNAATEESAITFLNEHPDSAYDKVLCEVLPLRTKYCHSVQSTEHCCLRRTPTGKVKVSFIGQRTGVFPS